MGHGRPTERMEGAEVITFLPERHSESERLSRVAERREVLIVDIERLSRVAESKDMLPTGFLSLALTLATPMMGDQVAILPSPSPTVRRRRRQRVPIDPLFDITRIAPSLHGNLNDLPQSAKGYCRRARKEARIAALRPKPRLAKNR